MDDAFPPFEPDGPERDPDNGDDAARKRRLREIPLRFVVPNIITVLAICAGLSAVRMAFEERFDVAIGLVLLAAVLDGLDGRMARLVKGTSRFGAEMDSLADAVNFGVVPALVLYIFVLDEAAQFGWIAALLYVIACTLRLARFNVMAGDSNRPRWQQAYFVGIPAPGGALVVLLPVYLGFLGFSPGWFTASVVSVFTIVIGFLMVSNLPVWSGKTLGARVPRTAVMPLILTVVLYVAALANFTWSTLTLSAIAYLCFLPFSVRLWRRQARRHAARTTPSPDAPDA
ncbi:CDP-diacylglycerol--serine O-phosphatidyltransferase [Roseitalea porphyridii]|uniref:CDP-diacylglycerol--serine O-phosphatidyltransferase n=1 Tax=Roseitalea porphyridii TaxID=1852022 RepID=A0A4P6V5T4_9HYPH|nr:CDP-diacylglycerol--serine O-phosphatidyltransferase [Roseitalea porphyridii]QBK32283.1 CDP-diacylglycerol--serine O-phosphatidyltransferase [Roseitalea porphyridii]